MAGLALASRVQLGCDFHANSSRKGKIVRRSWRFSWLGWDYLVDRIHGGIDEAVYTVCYSFEVSV